MKVFYINNDGSGFANNVDIRDGVTVEEFFTERLPDSKAEDYQIRVNRQPVARDQVLQDGDRISIIPVKMEGAA